jgi:alanine dehydrogenase
MMAVGMGAKVTIMDTSMPRLRELDLQYGNRIQTVLSTATALDDYLSEADLVIGAVLVPGAAAPKLVRRTHLETMKRGSVIVDVAIDQGGCVESARPTTHSDPTYVEEGVVHYCVANMPGAVARTSTLALNNATLPFALALANKGTKQALLDDVHLMKGLNVFVGKLTSPEVASNLGIELADRKKMLVNNG